MQQKINIHFWTVTGIILMVAISRLLPHLPNFTPVGAVCLFGAAHYSNKKTAYLVPLIAIWISDVLVNNILYAEYFDGFTWFYSGFAWQYASYVLTVLVGTLLIKKVNIKSVTVGALLATLVFFIMSNLGVWASGNMYPMTAEGLISCFAAALPFLGGTLLGNLLYCAVLFGGFAYAQNRIPALTKN